MSMFTRKKSIPDLLTDAQRKYSELCYRLGEIAYKQRVEEEEVRKLVSQLREVNKQGAKLQQKAKLTQVAEDQQEPGESNGAA